MKLLLTLLLAATVCAAQPPGAPVSAYNVVWTTPSNDSSGSMPLGNGDIGLNVWMEESGDLVFYIGKTDAWSETARLLKLGRVRVRLLPNPFAAGKAFSQTLDLARGEIVIRMGAAGAETVLRVWVDANNPAIRVEAESPTRIHMQAFYERWRDQQRLLEGKEAESAYGLHEGPEPIVSYPDSIVLEGDERVTWYHRNTRSSWVSIMKHQGLDEIIPALPDPLLNRTFGASMSGEGFTRMNATALRSREASLKHALTVVALTATTDSPEEWTTQVHSLSTRISAMPVAERRAAHDTWWNQFWNRSWIRVNGGGAQEAVSRGYHLQRFVTACAGRGASPIKFNGSIFTVDAAEQDQRFDADYRRWGGPYWFQNTRLIYWPLLAGGDYDMMQPFFRMYTEALLLARRRTKLYFEHEGVFFPETMYFWGSYPNHNYGWKRAGKPRSWIENTYIRNYYAGGLELVQMMFEYFLHTQDKQFLRASLVPVADEVIRFYDQHYQREAGKLVMKPAQSLETWPDVVNPLPDIAGLKYVLSNLLQAKVPLTKAGTEAARRLLSQLPAIPTGKHGSQAILLAAEQNNAPAQNSENPELYAIFPFRLYGVNKADYELGRTTFEARKHKGTGGWRQDAIQSAYLGIMSSARDYVVENFTSSHDGSRFPAFWGPNFDWVPDQDQGGVASIALQAMLMQTEGDRILMFPAWPKDWDVEFKLNAPRNTTVEGVIKGGQVQSLKVTPAVRAADLVKLELQ